MRYSRDSPATGVTSPAQRCQLRDWQAHRGHGLAIAKALLHSEKSSEPEARTSASMGGIRAGQASPGQGHAGGIQEPRHPQARQRRGNCSSARDGHGRPNNPKFSCQWHPERHSV